LKVISQFNALELGLRNYALRPASGVTSVLSSIANRYLLFPLRY
jgi:hypothetical protein